MSQVIYRVTIDGKPYSEAFQTKPEFASGWQSTLRKAYQRQEVLCGCPGRGTKQLAVKSYSTGLYGLARFPKSGEEHSRDCHYFTLRPERTGFQVYDKAVTENDDGSFSIKLAIGLRIADEPALPGYGTEVRHVSSRKKGTISLLGLCHLLWQNAGLNCWWPKMEGKRTAWLVHRVLKASAGEVIAGGRRLSEAFVLPATSPGHNDDIAEAQRRMRECCRRKYRCLVLAPLADFSEDADSKMGTMLRVYPYHGLPKLFMARPWLWKDTVRRFPYAYAAWKSGAKVYAIAQVEPRAGASEEGGDELKANVVSLALMAVNAQWIPFESSLELAVADCLVREERGFIKPMRFDADLDVVFPDFILIDTEHEGGCPMEVFGGDEPAYLARREAKTLYYDRVYGRENWWKWIGGGATIPSFPPKRGAVASRP